MAYKRTSSAKGARSVAQHSFAQIPSTRIPRSRFDRSCGVTTAFDAGFLYPVFLDEVLPGDTMTMHVNMFARLNPTVAPLMDNLYVDLFFFFVPCRLLWDNWHKFMGEEENPGDSTSFNIPKVTAPAGGWAEQSPADYLGVPPKIANLEHSALPLRAYNMIYNEWFRDENLATRATVVTDDGPDPNSNYLFILGRGKRHDYFTSCLPWPSKGPVVNLPLGTSAPVVSAGTGVPTFDLTGASNVSLGSAAANVSADWSSAPSIDPSAAWNTPSLEADLTNATAATINNIREAFQLQRLYERDARGGTRLTEIIRSHFGVISADQRLQRPEYLGGGSSRVVHHPVAQTSATNLEPTPAGNLTSFGTAAIDKRGFHKSFTEHGYILGIASLRADLTYQQGLNRLWSRDTRFDFYWPSLAHLGEQEVYNKEIYAQNDANDDLIFGYQERYAEYRYKPSEVTGRMRSTAATPLDVWHLGQEFSSLPVLNASFIREQPPLARVLAVPSEPAMLFDARYNYSCIRPMPVYGVPGYVDHF